MLRCVLQDVNGLLYEAPAPEYLSVDIDEGVPADSLLAVFPYFRSDELCSLTVYLDDKTVFKGIVDEEKHEFDADGSRVRISARSLAALLLDNEAMPCGYDHPTSALMYERYAKPYGIASADSDDAAYFGEQTITKGSSCWSVIRGFCLARYSALPRVSADGVLYMKGMHRTDKVTFGDHKGAIRYTALTESVRRCEELSAVRVKTAEADRYSLPVINADATARGIKRERYLNALLTSSPLRCADEMIANGAAKAYSLKLRCPGCHLGAEGCEAELADHAEELYVSAVHYRLTSKQEYTDITLKRRIGSCG